MDEPGSEQDAVEIVEFDAAGTTRMETLAKLARGARKVLPGDSDFGDPLSTSGDQASQLLGRRIAELSADRPSFCVSLDWERFRCTRRWRRAAGTSAGRPS